MFEAQQDKQVYHEVMLSEVISTPGLKIVEELTHGRQVGTTGASVLGLGMGHGAGSFRRGDDGNGAQEATSSAFS